MLDAISFQQHCEQLGLPPSVLGLFADAICRSLLGVDSSEVSALYVINYFKSGNGLASLMSDAKDGAQYIRARQGMLSLSNS